MTPKEMYNDVHNYCVDLILNSNIEDWIGGGIFIDNISIRIYWEEGTRKRFPVSIYNKNSMIEYEFFIEANIFCRRSIQLKHKKIRTYLRNIDEYNKAKKIYDLLPIKVLRKKKLESIKENKNGIS